MAQFPIFLLPVGDIMVTAKVSNGEIILLERTPFLTKKKYALSFQGLAACLDQEGKFILYGHIDENGHFHTLNKIQFERYINAKSFCIIDNNIIIGGENNQTKEVVFLSYSIPKQELKELNFALEKNNNCIEDLLIEDYCISIFDNSSSPLRFYKFDFHDPDYPFKFLRLDLPENVVFDNIIKYTQNEKFIALYTTTTSIDENTSYNIDNIYIFKKGYNLTSVRISLGFYDNYFYLYNNNILLIPSTNLLVWVHFEYGIGVYRIDDSYKYDKIEEDSPIIINRWNTNGNKQVSKILPVPNDEKKLVIIFATRLDDNNIQYSYELISIDEISEACEQRDIYERNSPPSGYMYVDDSPPSEYMYDDDSNGRDYFYAMTDGQMGDYDDFIDGGGDINEIDTWSGR